MLDFGTEGFGREGDGVALDVLVDGIIGKTGFYGLGNVNEFVERRDGKGLGVVFPIVSFGLQGGFEGIQFAAFGKRALKVLGQGDVESIEATEGIKFFPKSFCEG